MLKNIFYAQSGGATAVINASACGVIQTARLHPHAIGKVLAGKNGIMGALREELIDTSIEPPENIAALYHTPSCAFGSCRYQLKSPKDDLASYERLFQVFQAHNIGYFLYNGGGDSQDTTHKIAQMSSQLGYPLVCIGIPKTIDNDLGVTDNSPGFGSVAKYIATSVQEAALDVQSMAASSTKVFILEVMGRHAGWIAASADLGAHHPGDPPHIILFPEIAFEPEKFLAKVQQVVNKQGYCVIVASEGIRNTEGKLLCESSVKDAFGHLQLGGVAPMLADFIKERLGFKYHWAVADYLQRAARHLASQTDLEQAYALGRAAVEHAIAGKHNIMLTLIRESQHPYRWRISDTPLATVANNERKLPRHFIDEEGFKITGVCRDYLSPLIQGEAYPPYSHGLPHYVRLHNKLAAKQLGDQPSVAYQ